MEKGKTMEDLIICVAPVAGENQSEKFQGEMDVVREVIRSYDSGASIAHLHVRDGRGIQTADPTCFTGQVRGIHSACRIIIEGSTGGTPEHSLEQRCVAITVPGIEMGSLNMGSVNMAGGVYQNPFSDIRYYSEQLMRKGIKPSLCIFDLSMINNAGIFLDMGFLEQPLIYNFVLDVPEALPYSRDVIEFFTGRIKEDSVWFLTRHHAKGALGFMDALELGGHVRVGYEDGPFLSNGDRAKSNAKLVDEIVRAAQEVGRKVVDPDRAREILGIPGLKG